MDGTLETGIRFGCFAAVLLVMAFWEWALPRRHSAPTKSRRWLNNLGLAAFNTAAVRLLMPLGAVAVSLLAEERGWGLFHRLDLPFWAMVILSVIALDLIIYLQHVLFHTVPLLWRLHMVHHADRAFDASTGLRFHTIEILLSMGLKFAVVILLGTPALAVLIFEVLLNATSIFNHGNVRMPLWFDGLLRLIVVTPDMHRVHHSVIVAETNSNFGFNLPWWDFLFGTYRAQPAAGHDRMTIGLAHLQDERVDFLPQMLALPFIAETLSPLPFKGLGGERRTSR